MVKKEFKNYLFLTLSVLFNLNLSFSQNSNDTTIISKVYFHSKTEDSVRVNKFYLNDSLIKKESFTLNGQLLSVYHYKNNHLFGRLIEWYKSGAVSYEAFRNGGNGYLNYWYESGSLKSKAFFLDNLGLQFGYYDSGIIKYVRLITESEEIVGLSQSYYSSGKLKHMVDYSKSPIPFSSYYENGVLKEKGFYDKLGEKKGKWSCYKENGELIESINPAP